MQPDTRKMLSTPFRWTVIVPGTFVGLFAAANLPINDLGWGYPLLVILTLVFGSRIIVPIPRCKGQISISDTFVLLSLLLFGVEASVLLAGADALASSFRISRNKLTIAYNTAVFLLATGVTGYTLRALFGSMTVFTARDFSPEFIVALTLMGLIQYAVNSGLVACAVALKSGEPLWKTWHTNFLWTSLTYFAGAFAAGIIAKATGTMGVFAFIATGPIIIIIYFTYKTYLRNVEAAATQAELAQSHVKELSQHIAEQERISSALKESEEHFRTAFDHAVGMALVGLDNQWIEVNDSLASLLGYSTAELQKSSIKSVVHSDDLGQSLVSIHELIEGVVPSFQLENRYIHKDGHTIWALSSASLVRSDKGSPRHMVFQIQNISERKEAEEQIRFAAYHDSLTGMPNRTLFADRLSIAIERAKRTKEFKFAVLFIDLDRFKVVNDTMGHEAGDKLLIELSERLQECVRGVDTVARLGGDEFAVLLDGISNDEMAIEIVERIQERLKQPFSLDGQQFFLSASVGISFSSLGYDSPEDILRDADTAMYRAKANGKARYEIFDQGMHTRGVEALRLENDLRDGLECGEICCFYQPIVSLKDGSISGFEALARWKHPDRGLVSPGEFIPLAEETGLITTLGIQILKEACEQLYKWQVIQSNPSLTMSINLSAKQFAEEGLVEAIRKVIRDIQIDPGCIHLEITESILMGDAAHATDTLSQLKAIGVKLSIDDFGTGYSSLSYLHTFPFDIVKIDRSFVTRMNTDRNSHSIVETIITLAKKLGKSIVAEGIEVKAHQAELKNLSCEYGQGYYFSQPMESFRAEALLIYGLNCDVSVDQLNYEVPREIETPENLYSTSLN